MEGGEDEKEIQNQESEKQEIERLGKEGWLTLAFTTKGLSQQ